MNILHVITSLGDGGAEGALYRLCVHDRSNTHHVVSLIGGGKYESKLVEGGVSVTSLGLRSGRVTLRSVISLWKTVRRVRPDVLQTWLYHSDLLGGVVGKLAGVPAICWGLRHSNLSKGTVKNSTIFVARVCSIFSRFIPDRIISNSAQAVESHRQFGYPDKIFEVIPNGYDFSRLAPDADAREKLRNELGVAADVPLIGMVARFDPQKDHRNLLKALSLLQLQGLQFECVLVGTGMDHDNAVLMNWVRDEGLVNGLKLLGRRTDIAAIMNALDVHVLSSLGEAFPNVLAEAMACGTPCVTTDVGDAGLIVGDTGWIVKKQDSAALAAGIALALHEFGKRQDWQHRQKLATERVRRQFSIDSMVERFSHVWRDCLRK